MKKFVAVLSAAAMMTSLAACGSTADTTSTAVSSDAAVSTESTAAEATTDAKSYKIAVVQQLDHASLDEIRTAVEAELDAKAAEKGITIEYKDFNGQNDATTLNQIGTQVVSDGYDAIIPIATLAAQCMATAAESTKTPVIYAAISDPAAADLTDIDYVTGTSDALNTQSIMDMMFAVQPDIQTVGLLYSNSEANSTTPIAEAKAYLDAKGIAYVEKTGNTNDEIMTAASSMVGQVDAVFTPTDNVVMAAAAAVSETLTKGGIPFYTGADSFVTAGAFATCGVNYTELGTYTADMALDILETGTVPEYHVMDGGIITVNTETADALGIDYSAFNDLAGQVVEVTTAESAPREETVGAYSICARDACAAAASRGRIWNPPLHCCIIDCTITFREEVTLCSPLPLCLARWSWALSTRWLPWRCSSASAC